MTGEEIIAVGKAAGAVGKKALAEDEKTRDVLLRVAEGTSEMTAAARRMAARAAVKERVKLKLYQPFARMLGVSKAYFEDTFPQEMGPRSPISPTRTSSRLPPVSPYRRFKA